jgi:DNA polymerase III delta prime subunit
MSPQKKFISHFSPNRTAPADLEAIHVQRQELLDQVVDKLRESVLTPTKHHFLFVGPRGCGKTHMLTLIAHRLRAQGDIGGQLRLAWLNEDETSTTFLELLIRIFRALQGSHPTEFLEDDLKSTYSRSETEARSWLERRIIECSGGRTILILIENLDTMMKEMKDIEQRAWRAMIQNHNQFAIVATSQSLSPGVSKRDRPFFGFFEIHEMVPLKVEESVELMEKVARLNEDADLVGFLGTPLARARVHAIHHLAGGNQRLHIVLSDLINRETLEQLVGPFEKLVDEQLTPYYQERLRWLSPQQRKIVELLCRRGNPIPVKQIAGELFMGNSAAVQLKTLKDLGYVRSFPRGRESLYELAEPLMRLSLQVKDTRDRQPLSLLVDFLRVWYDREELRKRLSGSPIDSVDSRYFKAALSRCEDGSPDLLCEILRSSIGDTDCENWTDAQIDEMRVVAERSGLFQDWLQVVLACFFRCRNSDVVEIVNSIESSEKTPPMSEDEIRHLRLFRGFALTSLGRREEAEQAFEGTDSIVKQIDERAEATMYEYRGINNFFLGRFKQASEFFSKRIQMLVFSKVGADERWRFYAGRGTSLLHVGMYVEAFQDFNKVPSEYIEEVRSLIQDSVFIATSNNVRCDGSVLDLQRAFDANPIDDKLAAAIISNLAITLHSPDFIRDVGVFIASRGGEFKNLVMSSLSDGSISMAFKLTDDWPRAVKQIVEGQPNANRLSHLGDALVRHLKTLSTSLLNAEGLDRWVAAWAQCDKPELRLPIRLLKAGVDYLKSQPKDETVFYQLPAEERSLVRQALGLPPENAES